MTTNLVLMKESEELLELSKILGFSKTLFLDKDVVLVEGGSRKEVLRGRASGTANAVLKEVKEGKKKNLLVIVKVESEEILRFVLEKTEADIIFGQESINPKDSMHFRRGGLDQITCRIAAERDKTIGFSFKEILEAEGNERSKLIGRIMFNVKLCKKYGVKILLGNFSENKWELRGKYELKAFENILKF